MSDLVREIEGYTPRVNDVSSLNSSIPEAHLLPEALNETSRSSRFLYSRSDCSLETVGVRFGMFLQMRNYAIKIQSCWRGKLARMRVARIRKRLVGCVCALASVDPGAVCRAFHRRRAAEELLSSERSYHDQLSSLAVVFVRPILSATDSKQQQPIIRAKEVPRSLQAVEALLSVSRQYRRVLERRLQEWTPSSKMGDIFIKFAPEFQRVYLPYVKNVDEATATLGRLKKKNPLQDFLETQTMKYRSLLNNNDLFDLLITPVQRIPRLASLLNVVSC